MLDSYTFLGGFAFLLMLTLLVAAHELGHHLFARMFGMEVEAFAIMVGGVRKTDLRQYLEKPLVSGWIVAGVLGALIAAWDLTIRYAGSLPFDPQPLVLAIQVGVVLVVPLWIASRLAALYHASFGNIAKRYVFAWLAWLFAASAFGATKGFELTGFIPLLAPVSALALIFTYYMPVMTREEEDQYGHGKVNIDGETVPVRYRPVAAYNAKSGTEYSILMLPFGGFAKIKGMQPKEDGSEVNIPGGFFSKAPWKRILVLFAGPLFSVIAGVALLTATFSIFGAIEPDPIVGIVYEGSPAEKAGLKPGDRIIRLDGKPMATFAAMRDYVAKRAGKELTLTFSRNGKEQTSVLVPITDAEARRLRGDPEKGTQDGRIGMENQRYRPVTIGQAFQEALQFPIMQVEGLVQAIQKPSELKDSVGGMATVAAATDSAVRSKDAKDGFFNVFMLASLLSISLGIFNLLPIYPLDGGQIAVAVAEMFRGGRRLSLKVQNAFSTVGFALICMLVLFVLVNDTKRLGGADRATETAPTKATPDVKKDEPSVKPEGR